MARNNKCSLEDKLKNIEAKIQIEKDKIELLNYVRDDIFIQMFYRNHNLKYGQPFIYKGKKILLVKVFQKREGWFVGFYKTQYGALSKQPIKFNGDCEVQKA